MAIVGVTRQPQLYCQASNLNFVSQSKAGEGQRALSRVVLPFDGVFIDGQSSNNYWVTMLLDSPIQGYRGFQEGR